MEKKKIEEEVKAAIVDRLKTDPEKIKMESAFVDDLGADSLDLVELVMLLEEKFTISIPDEDFEKMRTVGEAIDYIEDYVNQIKLNS
jgi:acyl carrier protein